MIDPNYPLVELHRHLDGNMRLETMLDLAQQHNLSLPASDVEGLRPYAQVVGDPEGDFAMPSVMDFIAKFRWLTACLVDYDACWRLAHENVEDAQREGIDHIELRFSPWFMAETHALDPAGVVEAVVDGIDAGRREFGVGVSLIGILSRTYGTEIAWRELEALLQVRDRLVALDLAGDEAHYPGELFVKHFRKARDAGWEITIHAGEFAGSESVWQALRELGATRIGHAVAAHEDPDLLAYMVEHQIAVETSLTSNVQTSTVPDYARHPARAFLQRGLMVTLNTDDPGISNIDLPYEYTVAAPAAGLTEEQIRQTQRNALSAAFLGTDERQALLDKKAKAEGGRLDREACRENE